MCRKFFPIYTKSFGGKIWTNLHSVSPGNKFGKKINGVLFKHYSLTKKSKSDPTNFARQININHLGNKLQAIVNFCSIFGQFKKPTFEIFNETFVLAKFHFRDGLCLNNLKSPSQG